MKQDHLKKQQATLVLIVDSVCFREPPFRTTLLYGHVVELNNDNHKEAAPELQYCAPQTDGSQWVEKVVEGYVRGFSQPTRTLRYIGFCSPCATALSLRLVWQAGVAAAD